MLYGINSRERDKAGFIADKNRYAPWSGAAMSGRMDCRVGTDELSLTRATRRQTAPMGDFQALHVGHGEPHDIAACGLQGADLGDSRLGVRRLRIRHRLHGDRRTAADRDLADVDLARRTALL